jgi:flagellar export protein FliJ
MAFHFSLNGVLRLRESLEKAELQQLRAIAAAVAFSRADLDSLDKNIETARRWTLDATATRGLTGAELHFEVLREGVLQTVRSSLAEKLAALERKRDEQQQRYLQARRQREILSNLYQRQLAAYRLEQSRREQQRIDELFLIRSNFTPE